GNSVILSGSGADNYNWSHGVVDGIAFVPTSSMFYMVTGTDASTSCTNIDSVFVSVSNLPDTSVLQNGNQLQAVLSCATYQWVDCTNLYAPLANDTTVVIIATITGDYAMVVSQYNCSATSSCYNITIVSKNDILLKDKDYKDVLYPSPTIEGK